MQKNLKAFAVNVALSVLFKPNFVPKREIMKHYLSIGLFLIQKNPIRIPTNGIALLVEQLIEVLYSRNISEYDLDRYSEILDLHINDLDILSYCFYKNLIAAIRTNIKSY